MATFRQIAFLSLLVIILSLASCIEVKVPSGDAIPYVARVLGNPSSTEHQALFSADGSDVSGAIAIIGAPEACVRLTEKFLGGDDFDNIDGRKVPDGLPDFAGETFISYMDAANTPYEGYAEKGNQMMLREIAVRNFLKALDTLALETPFGDSSSVTKPRAKMVVMASPLLADAKADIDTLLHISGRDIPIVWAASEISSEDSLGVAANAVVCECYRIMRDRNSFTHNIAWPQAKAYLSFPAYGFDPQDYTEGGFFEENYRYSRPNNSETDTYTFIKYSDEYMPEDLLDYLRTEAIRTYRYYVQD